MDMKRRLGQIGRHCLAVMGSPLTWLIIALCVCAVFLTVRDTARELVLWRDMVTLPEPEECALCEVAAREAPCLLELGTGGVAELAVSGAGEGVEVPEEGTCINPGLFCRECRARLGEVTGGAGIARVGYVLVEVRDLGDIRVYPVERG